MSQQNTAPASAGRDRAGSSGSTPSPQPSTPPGSIAAVVTRIRGVRILPARSGRTAKPSTDDGRGDNDGPSSARVVRSNPSLPATPGDGAPARRRRSNRTAAGNPSAAVVSAAVPPAVLRTSSAGYPLIRELAVLDMEPREFCAEQLEDAGTIVRRDVLTPRVLRSLKELTMWRSWVIVVQDPDEADVWHEVPYMFVQTWLLDHPRASEADTREFLSELKKWRVFERGAVERARELLK